MIDLNEYADLDTYKESKETMRNSLRNLLIQKGFEGEALENKIREITSKPPSPKLVKIFNAIRETSEKAIEYYYVLKQKGYQGEDLKNKLRQIVSKTPEEIKKIIEETKK